MVGALALIVLGIFIVWIACYCVWRDERRRNSELTYKLNDAEQRCKEEKAASETKVNRSEDDIRRIIDDKRPRLVGYIPSLTSKFPSPTATEIFGKGEGNGLPVIMQITLLMYLSNETQIPTTILDFRLSVKANGKQYESGPPLAAEEDVPQLHNWHINYRDRNIENFEKVFPNKTKLVAPHQPYWGFLVFDMSELHIKECGPATEYIVTVTDATGGKHSAIKLGTF